MGPVYPFFSLCFSALLCSPSPRPDSHYALMFAPMLIPQHRVGPLLERPQGLGCIPVRGSPRKSSMPDTSLAIRKTVREGRGYNQVGRELASGEWNPGRGPQHHRKPDLATHTCNSSSWDSKGRRVSNSRSSWANKELEDSRGSMRPCLKVCERVRGRFLRVTRC